MCELCARHSAPKSTPVSKLPRDAAKNVVCTRKGCDCSFCEKCILLLCGGAELNLARNVPGWICFLCRNANFVRPDHEMLLYQFLQPNNPNLTGALDLNEVQAMIGNHQMDVTGYKESEFTLESFAQQQWLIDSASKKNEKMQLTKRDSAWFHQGGLRVLSLFGGIEASLVALKQLSLKIDLYVSVEKDEDARKVTAANHVDLLAKAKLIFVNDILDVDASLLLGLQKAGSGGGGFHLVIGGSPCQDFSYQGNLNGGERPGLDGDNGKLVYEFFRVLGLVERLNSKVGFPKPAFVYENVAGMDSSIKKTISSWLGVEPTRLNADLFSPASRPRDFYTNIPVELLPGDTENNDLKMPTLQQILTSPAQALTPKAKCIITSNGAEVFATGRTNVFYQFDKKWIDHFNRVYRNRYDHSLGFRNLSIGEVERLQGLPPGYMSVVDTARSKDFNRCWGLLGNMFSVPVVVYLLSPFLQNVPATVYHTPVRYPFEVELSPRIPFPEDSLLQADPTTVVAKPTTAAAAKTTITTQPNQIKEKIVVSKKVVENSNDRDYNNDEEESDEEMEILPGPTNWVPGLDSLPTRFKFICCDKCNTWRRIPAHIKFDEGETFFCKDNIWSNMTFDKTCQWRNDEAGKSSEVVAERARRSRMPTSNDEDDDDGDDEEGVIPELTEVRQEVVDELQAELRAARSEIERHKGEERARLLRQQDLIAMLAATASVPASFRAADIRSQNLAVMQKKAQDELIERTQKEHEKSAHNQGNLVTPPSKKKGAGGRKVAKAAGGGGGRKRTSDGGGRKVAKAAGGGEGRKRTSDGKGK